MNTAPVVEALQTTVASVRRRHRDLPELTVILYHPKHSSSYGYFHSARQWGEAMEIGISLKTLTNIEGDKSKSPYATARLCLGVLLHECTHALCYVREITDIKDNGYHTTKFRDLAAELGILTRRWADAPQLGYDGCKITPECAAMYRKNIRQIHEALCSV